MSLPKYENDFFYPNHQFDVARALQAYAELFRFHQYSLAESVLKRPDIWITDFGLDNFLEVGFGGVCFVNHKEYGYFCHSIYLLPGQMIAEHYHLPALGKPAKHETWHVQHGSIWTLAQGGDKSKMPFRIPECEEATMTCFDAKYLQTGDMDALKNLEEPHYMMAGPEGAIVSEYACFHSGEGFRLSNPKAKV